jgi:hypothetical protein
MSVVQQVQAAIDACRSHLQWAHEAQQLQQKLQGLQAAVASAEAGAGRSVVTCATLTIKWLGTPLTCCKFCVLLVCCKGHSGAVCSAMKPAIWLLPFFFCHSPSCIQPLAQG